MSLINNKPDFVERVMRYRKNDIMYPLAEADKERLDVIKYFHELLGDARTVKQIIPRLKEKFPAMKLSKTTVYRMHDECMQVYGNRKVDSEYYRGFVLDWTLELLQVAKKRGDLKAWDSAIKRLIEILRLNTDTMDLPDFEKYMNQVFVMNVTVNNNKIPIDLNQAEKFGPDLKNLLLEADDIDFDDIKQ